MLKVQIKIWGKVKKIRGKKLFRLKNRGKVKNRVKNFVKDVVCPVKNRTKI